MSAAPALLPPSWRSDPAPLVTDARVGQVQIARWQALAPGLSRAAAEICMAAWEAGWPPGLLAHACLLADDGVGLLHYLQWEDAAPAEVAGLDTVVPGVMRQDAMLCRLHRSRIAMRGRAPGAVAVIQFEAQDEACAARFIAAMTDPALEAPAGLLAGHYHLAAGGRRVVNYAEWESVEANQAFLGSPAQAAFNAVAAASPGVRPAGGRIYRPFVRRRRG